MFAGFEHMIDSRDVIMFRTKKDVNLVAMPNFAI